MTLRLAAACYRRIRSESRDSAGVLDEMIENIVADVLDLRQRGLLENVQRHYACSTVLGIPLNYGLSSWAALHAAMRDRLREHSPGVLVTLYECASWGYVLDHWFRCCRSRGAVLITIVDCNPMGLDEWEQTRHWGPSGFGYAQLCFENAGELASETVATGVTDSANALLEFSTFVRRRARGAPQATVSAPFNLPEMSQMIARYLGGLPRLPDLHSRWGHCFGSDPWIGIATDQIAAQRAGEVAPKPYHACSNGLGGFFASAYVTADGGTFVALR